MSIKETVVDIVKNHVQDNPNFMKEVLEHGCQSGIVNELIYIADTLEFYEKHKKEINLMLANLVEDTGQQPAELFRNWDYTDPLAVHAHNQNLLAWFGFEEIVRELLEESN